MSGLIPVAEALARVLGSVTGPTAAETVPLAEAAGRTLADDVSATRTQPPFPASAMDGYAVRSADAGQVDAVLRVIGTSAAGHGFSGRIGAGETVRIFTGAPVPEGADAILIQEDARAEGDRVRVAEPVEPNRFIRRAGLDFTAGEVLLSAGMTLDARRLALAAAAGHPRLPVRRRPLVATNSSRPAPRRPGTRSSPPTASRWPPSPPRRGPRSSTSASRPTITVPWKTPFGGRGRRGPTCSSPSAGRRSGITTSSRRPSPGRGWNSVSGAWRCGRASR
jgi:hypothetical protein